MTCPHHVGVTKKLEIFQDGDNESLSSGGFVGLVRCRCSWSGMQTETWSSPWECGSQEKLLVYPGANLPYGSGFSISAMSLIS